MTPGLGLGLRPAGPSSNSSGQPPPYVRPLHRQGRDGLILVSHENLLTSPAAFHILAYCSEEDNP